MMKLSLFYRPYCNEAQKTFRSENRIKKKGLPFQADPGRDGINSAGVYCFL